VSTPARFLSRWSRLKRQAADTPELPAALPEASPVAGDSGTPAPGVEPGAAPDLTGLLREELSEAVRRQTLKAIFADPHFNVMDGLDVYIDDYSISDPIPEEMLATLNQARFLFASDEEPKRADAATPTELTGDVAPIGCDNLNQGGQEVAIDLLAESAAKEK